MENEYEGNLLWYALYLIYVHTQMDARLHNVLTSAEPQEFPNHKWQRNSEERLANLITNAP